MWVRMGYIMQIHKFMDVHMTDTLPHLNYLGFKLMTPSPLLRPYIQSYWVIRRDNPLATEREEFLHPNGGMGLVFNLGDVFDYEGQRINAPYFMDGANTVSRTLHFYGKIDAIGIRFHVGGAYPFFAMPLHELMDNVLILNDIDRRDICYIHEAIYEAPALHDKIAIIESWLIGRMTHSDRVTQDVMHSLQLIQNDSGRVNIKAIADTIYLSQRQLERLFKIQVGITPKRYARLLRVDHARNLLKNTRTEFIADIGAASGFYDQSHFIREFKAVVGMTPGDYRLRSEKRAQAKID